MVDISYASFKRGYRCKICANNVRLSLDFIKNMFSQKDYTLLSEEYINNKTKLEYVCPVGHKGSITWNNFKTGYGCPICALSKRSKENHYRWKGGVHEKALPLYDTFNDKLSTFNKTYKVIQEGLELLGVECTYCAKVFVPSTNAVRSRECAVKSPNNGESNFYCSENCKKACPTYRKQKYPKGFKPATSREVQPELRKLVLARDNYKCQICEAGLDDVELHCHHITGVEQNPIESADIDNCITLCKKHHKQVHTLPNCVYNELRCN